LTSSEHNLVDPAYPSAN